MASSYRGVYYNSNDESIYVADETLSCITVFDLDLETNISINLTDSPRSITGYNGKLYVGLTNGNVLMMENNAVLQQFDGCNQNSVAITSILFDNFGYMATLCYDNNIYLYNSNGTYAGLSFSTDAQPQFIGFDSQGIMRIL